MKVSLVQMNSGASVQDNLQRAAHWLAEAAKVGANLIVLPENFAFMGESPSAVANIAETPGKGAIQAFLASEAKKNAVWLVGGTMPLFTDDKQRLCAACLVYSPDGELFARYNKMHLFDVTLENGEHYAESKLYQAGRKPTTVDTPWGAMGLAICYDMRFPETWRACLSNAPILWCVPSAFTEPTGQAHWHVLLRARAIENLTFILAAAQTGEHPSGRRTFGHSLIVDPWGKVLAELPTGEGILTATIDLALQTRLRRQFPALQHGRVNCIFE